MEPELHDRLRAWVRVATDRSVHQKRLWIVKALKARDGQASGGIWCRETDQGTQTLSDGRYVGTHPAGLCYGSSSPDKSAVSRHTIWVDGGLMVNPLCSGWSRFAVGLSKSCDQNNQRVCVAEKTLDGWTDFRLVDGLSSISQGLWTIARKLKSLIRLMLRRLA